MSLEDTCVRTYAYACQVWITLQVNLTADCLTVAMIIDKIQGIVDENREGAIGIHLKL